MAFVVGIRDANSKTTSSDSIPEVVDTKAKVNSDEPEKFLKSYELCQNRNEWWKNTVIYEVYVRSFCDFDGDGIGDLTGIRKKLQHFVDLGVETIWLTPFYPSPMVDFGYDISNFKDVDPTFGTLAEFKHLLGSAKDKGLKIILDFVPNHTSDQHEWFKKSVKKENPYTNYYVWAPIKERDGDGNPIAPNNWKSVFGGSAWEYHPIRKEFYLHQFAKEQPDLDFRNVNVLQEMNNVLDFWLELGVDGFRLDAAPHLLEDPLLRDNPQNESCQSEEITEDDYAYWSHNFTTNVPGNLEVIQAFRSVCDVWAAKTGQEKVLMTEGYLPLNELFSYYGDLGNPVAHFSFNFELLNLSDSSTGLDAYRLISNWFDHLPRHCWSNWQIGNHDQPRVGNRCGEESIDMMNIINLLLPGTAITYYGEEIGMLNTSITWEETVDPAGRNKGPLKYRKFSRDPERTPMQWTDMTNAGFAKGASTWLPVNPNFLRVNVKSNILEKESHMKVYKQLTKLRKTNAWKYGGFEIGSLCNHRVVGFTRVDVNATRSNSGLLVVTNFSKENVTVDATCFNHVPQEIILVAKSVQLSSEVLGTQFDTNNISLDGKTGAVFKFTF